MAFWSGVDNADEYETRFYGVFGLLNKEEHAELFRVFVNKEEISLSKDVIFEKRKETDEEIKIKNELTEIENQTKKLEDKKVELTRTIQLNKKNPEVQIDPEWLTKINKLTVHSNTVSVAKESNGLSRFPSLRTIKENNPSTSFKRDWFNENQQSLDFSSFDENEIEWETLDEDLLEDCVDGIIDQTDAFMDSLKTEELLQQLEDKGVLSYLVKKIKERGLC